MDNPGDDGRVAGRRHDSLHAAVVIRSAGTARSCGPDATASSSSSPTERATATT